LRILKKIGIHAADQDALESISEDLPALSRFRIMFPVIVLTGHTAHHVLGLYKRESPTPTSVDVSMME